MAKFNGYTSLLITSLFPFIVFSFKTLLYGGTGGDNSITILDQGRITGISSWGYETSTYHGIIIDSWTSDSKSNSDKLGTKTIETQCNPFNLISTDYIDSFHVIFSNNSYVRMIEFGTNDGHFYQCIIDTPHYSNLTNLLNTGRIKISGTYLTGFMLRYGHIIDAIGFQFSDMNTLITTTDIYGGYGGSSKNEIFNQGRIYEISNWGYSASYDDAVGIITWSADAQTETTSLGDSNYIDTPCTSFTLSFGLRIIGYRIMYGEYVYYIGFKISDDTTRECQASPLPNNIQDTGWKTVFPPSYLSGFWSKHGAIIDEIMFQFTAFPLTCPTGSTQVGTLQSDNDIGTCGLNTNCNDRFDTNNIIECRDKCLSNTNCKAFNFAPRGGDEYNSNQIVCTLYDSRIPTHTFGYQIFCSLLTINPTADPTKTPTSYPTTTAPTKYPTETLICPNGSEQRGTLTINNDIPGCGIDNVCDDRMDTNNIIECRDKCLSNIKCKAFNYAPRGDDPNNLNDIVCTLYDSEIPTVTHGYQIFCDLITVNPTSDPTSSPTTITPTTVQPTTAIPTTIMPTTVVPTTTIPTTAVPTTTSPTTTSPTTLTPTTYNPTTKDGEVNDKITTELGGDNNGHKTDGNGNTSDNNMILYVIIGVVVILFCCVFYLACIYIRRNKNKNKVMKKDTIEMEKAMSISTNEEMLDSNIEQANTNTVNTGTIGENMNDEINDYQQFSTPMGHSLSPEQISPNDNENDDENDEDDALYETNEERVTKGGEKINTPVTKGNDEIDVYHNALDTNNINIDEVHQTENDSDESNDNGLYSKGNNANKVTMGNL